MDKLHGFVEELWLGLRHRILSFLKQPHLASVQLFMNVGTSEPSIGCHGEQPRQGAGGDKGVVIFLTASCYKTRHFYVSAIVDEPFQDIGYSAGLEKVLAPLI